MNYASFLSNTFLIHCIDRYDKRSDSVRSVPTYCNCIVTIHFNLTIFLLRLINTCDAEFIFNHKIA